jgi:DNA ligase (NAD+)
MQRVADEAYGNGTPVMDDEVYDATFGDSSNHHEFILDKTAVDLPTWMGSLDKKRDQKSIDVWLNKTKTVDFIVSGKLDGISALFDTTNKKLFTRGNGQKGNDISQFLNYLNLEQAKKSANHVFKVLLDSTSENQGWSNLPHICVRGELIMPKRKFEEKYSKSFKNARNLVAGQFNRKTIDKKNISIIGDIVFIPYEVIVIGAPFQCPLMEQIRWSPSLPWTDMKRSEVNVDSLTQFYNRLSNECEFTFDGLVVTENRMYQQSFNQNPKHSIAFKKDTDLETAISTVTSVAWSVSRWGLFKPVVHIEPVQISGVTVKKCNGMNAKFILENKIGPGAQVVCVRSGDVIPNIASVIIPSHNVTLPDSQEWKGVNLCANKIEQNDMAKIKMLTNILAKFEVKHISTKTVQKMFEDCQIDSFFKFLNCTKSQLQPTFKDKTSEMIINELTKLKSKSIDIHVLVGSAGLLGCGLGTKKVVNLFKNIHSWDTVPSVEEVCEIEGFANKTAEMVVKHFPSMISFVKLCIANGLLVDGFTSNSSENLLGVEQSLKKRICLSGFRDAKLEEKHIVSASVTKDCEFLVCKSLPSTNQTSKMKKAEMLGIRIISLKDFLLEDFGTSQPPLQMT